MSDTNFIDETTVIEADWLNDINDHVYNSTPVSPATTVHPASVIANTPAGTIAATTVQDALNELDTEKATTGSVATAQAAADAAQVTADNHIADTVAAHTASAIANTPAGSIAATDVQAAINELDTEKAALAGSASQAFSVLNLEVGHASDTTLTRSAAGTIAVEGVDLLTTSTGGKRVAQIVTTQVGTVATGTTVIPFDNTIPQNTKCDQYMSLAITPQSATSVLEIKIDFFGTASISSALTVALFQDSTANALACTAQSIPSAGFVQSISFTHSMTSGTTSATTFKVRAGAGGAGTTTFNGSGGSQLYGGVVNSRIIITEYLP